MYLPSDTVANRKLQQAPPAVRTTSYMAIQKAAFRRKAIWHDATFSIALYQTGGTQSRWFEREGAQFVASFHDNGN